MVYHCDREYFIKVIAFYYPNIDKFFDEIEDNCKTGFECVITNNEEIFIINTLKGLYINWYKLTHIGRTNSMNFNPKYLTTFIESFRGGR